MELISDEVVLLAITFLSIGETWVELFSGACVTVRVGASVIGICAMEEAVSVGIGESVMGARDAAAGVAFLQMR